jgi:hypothetical protein
VGATIGVTWSDPCLTINKIAIRGEMEQARVVSIFKNALESCPVGRHMELIRDSGFMLQQWNDINTCAARKS